MPTVPTEKTLGMATIGWDRSLGLPDEIGSIEVGKKADLVLFDPKRPKWRNLINPMTNPAYNVDGRSVHSAIVEGQVAIENHALTCRGHVGVDSAGARSWAGVVGAGRCFVSAPFGGGLGSRAANGILNKRELKSGRGWRAEILGPSVPVRTTGEPEHGAAD